MRCGAQGPRDSAGTKDFTDAHNASLPALRHHDPPWAIGHFQTSFYRKSVLQNAITARGMTKYLPRNHPKVGLPQVRCAQRPEFSSTPDSLSGAWSRVLRIASRSVRGVTARRQRGRWAVNHLLRRQPALIAPLAQPGPPVLDRIGAVHPSVRLPVVEHRGAIAGRQADLHRVGLQLRLGATAGMGLCVAGRLQAFEADARVRFVQPVQQSRTAEPLVFQLAPGRAFPQLRRDVEGLIRRVRGEVREPCRVIRRQSVSFGFVGRCQGLRCPRLRFPAGAGFAYVRGRAPLCRCGGDSCHQDYTEEGE